VPILFIEGQHLFYLSYSLYTLGGGQSM
jgi:hypothetical protein